MINLSTFSRFDYWSLTAVPVELDYQGVHLSHGTGFFYIFAEQTYLVTAWHVLSGKNSQTGQSLAKTGALPSHITIWWNPDGQPGGAKSSQRLALFEVDGSPCRLEKKRDAGWIDVALLPVTVPPTAQAYHINELPQKNTNYGMGGDLFILGFPLANQPLKLPIWKRASLASEPEIPEVLQPYKLVDTASRSGMSGAPVIHRTYDPWDSQRDFLRSIGNPGHKGVTNFQGIYSGRFLGNSPEDAQLGIVWPSWWISTLISERLGRAAYEAGLPGELERGVRVLRDFEAALKYAVRTNDGPSDYG